MFHYAKWRNSKWRNSVYVLTEVCHQRSKWLGPKSQSNFFLQFFAVFLTPEVSQRKVSDSQLPCIEEKNLNLNVTDEEVYFLDHKLLEFRDFFHNYVLIPIKSSLNVLWHSPKRTLLLIQILNCTLYLSLIHIWRCRRYSLCRSRWSPYH